jgi:hypothetical protein
MVDSFRNIESISSENFTNFRQPLDGFLITHINVKSEWLDDRITEKLIMAENASLVSKNEIINGKFEIRKLIEEVGNAIQIGQKEKEKILERMGFITNESSRQLEETIKSGS